jgi:two-component system, NtrC family, nitrogen regulation sensor histidine kinase NtrY
LLELRLRLPTRLWPILILATLAAVTEWVRTPTGWSAAASTILALAAAGSVVLSRPGWWPRVVVGILLALGVALPVAQQRISALGTNWPDERERRIESASRRLEGDLRQELDRIVTLARRAADRASLRDDELFHQLEALVPRGTLETGVVVLRPDGTPRAWAGLHHLEPVAAGDSLAARFSRYLSVFETRRTLVDGGTVVASVLLDADPVIPGANRSLSERFRQRTEVGLSIYPPDGAPENGDVFDYEEPTTAGPRVLFSVRPRPPTQGEATERAVESGSRLALLLTLLLVPAGMLLAHTPPVRYLFLGGLLWIVMRTPALEVVGLGSLVSPVLFFREMPLGVTTVLGPLLVCGLLLIQLGVRLWLSPGPRPVPALVVGFSLLASAPYLVRTLGQGITPPAAGVTIPLWLMWETTLLLATAGMVVVSAGLLRQHTGHGRSVWPLLGAGWAMVAAVIGVFAWEGRSGWPEWYTFLWLPALLLVTRPAARWATILGVAVVAGSAAALMTWGAELEGRVELARRDLMQLGNERELLAEPLLRGLGAGLRAGAAPRDPADLLATWRRSALDQQGYPARLDMRGADGVLRHTVLLDQVDLPDSLIVMQLQALDPTVGDTVIAARRTPGIHYLLVQRLAPDTVVTVVLGPRSRLVPPARLGRLLAPSPGRAPYRVSLSPAAPPQGSETSQVRWRREGWTIRGERTLWLADGPRQAYAAVEMLTPGPLLVRGALVLFVNVILLSLLWRLAELVAGVRPKAPELRQLLRSFRAQLFAALALFFILPLAGFALWSLLRLNEEARRDREQVVTQALRDVLASDAELAADGPTLPERLAAVGSRSDVELGVYRGGRLVAATSPILESFGLLPPLMDPQAYHDLAIDGERDAVGEGADASAAGLVGYRSFRVAGDGESAVLAAPQAAHDPALAARQLELVLALLLASLIGVMAALLAAQAAARRLSRPVADLRHAALAFGSGEEMAAPEAEPPVEFEPVFAAFQKMADDIRRNQETQERAARVLAWGEMASQVAHEIKNPLTPMRLGIQHLQRVWRDRRERMGEALDETAPRVLSEIDRLDRIARSFSRYGAPGELAPALEPVDLARELAEVVPLYGMGEAPMEVEIATAVGSPVLARRDEVKEVLLNLLENARDAGARRVVLRIVGRTLTVQDDGRGIPPETLDRIFEPRFSTTTSGSGLGLGIVRRLVEGWGGSVTVESQEGSGTTFTIRFAGPG